jgi:hypothetical protein
MGTVTILTLLFLLLTSSAVVIVLPLSVPRAPQVNEIPEIVGSVCACVASRYCQLKSNRADFLPRARSLNVEQSKSYQFG